MYVAFRWKQARLRYTPGHTESHSTRKNTVSRRLLRYSSLVFNLNITNPVNTLKLARPSFQILIQTIAIRRGFFHSSGRAAIFLPAIGRARVVACRVVLQFGSRQIYQPRRATKYLHTFQVITGCISKNYARSLMDRTVVARRCFRKFFRVAARPPTSHCRYLSPGKRPFRVPATVSRGYLTREKRARSPHKNLDE